MKIGELIKEYRKDHGMSQEAFATRSGLSKGYVSIIENGVHPRTGKPLTPSAKVMKQVADAIGMPLQELRQLTEPLDWNDTIYNDEPTKEELKIYSSLDESKVYPIYKEAFQQLERMMKTMDEDQIKQLLAYARFLKQEGSNND